MRLKAAAKKQFRYGGSRMRKATGRCSPQFTFLNFRAQGQAETLSGLAKAEESFMDIKTSVFFVFRPLNSFRKYLLKEVRKMLRQKRAQSTLEYIIIFTAVVGAILLAANTIIKPKVNSMLEHVAEEAENAVQHVSFQ